MTVRGILFDLDDTLFDYGGAERAGILAHLTAEGLVPERMSAERAMALWREVMEVEYTRFVNGEVTFTGQQRARARRFVRESGGPELDDDAAGAWFARYHHHYQSAWRAFPDAGPVLADLSSRYLIGIVSNASEEKQRLKLGIIGLGGYFAPDHLVLCGREFGAFKPDPAIFLAGCEALGLRPEETAYVGDQPETDAVGALRAGLVPYLLDRAGTAEPIPGVTVIGSLEELAGSLDG